MTYARTYAQRGFTLLLSALVASAVLAIGTAIYTLAVKQVNLSSLGRDSQFAFYTADTAAECALFWDIRYNYFDIVAPLSVNPPDPRCSGQELAASGRTGAFPQTIVFRFEPDGRCADVSVTKTRDIVTQTISTTIHADGYSTACVSLDTNPTTLQRSIEFNY